MTTRDMMALINRTADYRVGDLTIQVKITDVRNRFGTTDVQITPISGKGEQWVQLTSVRPHQMEI